jgi:hypothetical protein
MTPEPEMTGPPEASLAPLALPEYRWYHKVGAVVFIMFCLEIGIFLIIFPWLDGWDRNYFSNFNSQMRALWASPYFRGAISGLGLINVYIAFLELFRLRRFAGSSD